MRTLCLLFALAASAHAQPTVIDVEFVEALFGSGFTGDAVEVTPGAAPADVRALLPPDVDVLGSLWRESADGDRFGMVVARTDTEAETVESAFREREMPGWIPVPVGDSPMPRGGFVSSTGYDGPVRLMQAGDLPRLATLSVRPRPSGGAFVVVEVEEGNLDEEPERSFDALAPYVPLLASPPGAAQRSGSSSGGYDDYETRGTIETDLTPQDLLTHYGDQLVAEGWTRLADGASADAAVSTWTRSADGERFAATLEAVRDGAETFDLRFSVVARDR